MRLLMGIFEQTVLWVKKEVLNSFLKIGRCVPQLSAGHGLNYLFKSRFLQV